MELRMALYQFLVNRKAGIAWRYHRFHDGKVLFWRRILSFIYLLWLNFAYYILFMKFLGKVPEVEIYERKRLNTSLSESEANRIENPSLSVENFINTLKAFDVVSFDLFDTLIFRPLDKPTDVFYFLGEWIGIPDFKNIRIQAESTARQKNYIREKNYEISLSEIWVELSSMTGTSAEGQAKREMEAEAALCYANPFMLQVWNRLGELGKKRILVSDMYLPEEFLVKLAERNGYSGFDRLYVSNKYHKSKADGSLYDVVLKDFCGCRIIHVGDNPHSDGKMAMQKGIAALLYPAANKKTFLYRPYDMSYLVGSAYRAIVDNRLYCGLYSFSMEYEYGFIYGGLFVLGYCNFIHEYCKEHGIEKVLFLSRDGDILKQVYDYLYPDEKTEYVYWSRKAAVKLMAEADRHDFFRRFINHKVNQGYSIKDVLHSMELDFLIIKIQDAHNPDFNVQDLLSEKNCAALRNLISDNWDAVLSFYGEQRAAAEIYFREILSGCRSAAAVDIGWAGSGALSLAYLTEKCWKIPCSVTGIVAGTNTIYNTEPDASEPFLQSGKLVAYLYSQSHNRDLIKKHDPNKDYNVFWELLVSSPTPQFVGFYQGNQAGREKEDIYLEKEDITLKFGKYDPNPEGIREIQQGILDFVRDYTKCFKNFPYMSRISGRDAYAPMLLAASYDEKYAHVIETKFSLDKNIV